MPGTSTTGVPDPLTDPHRIAAARRLLAEVSGPAAGLALLDGLELSRHHLFHAVRADLLRRLGRRDEAVMAYDAAIALAGNDSDRTFLRQRRASLDRP